MGSDLLKEIPSLVAFIFFLTLLAAEHFEESVLLYAALVITSVCLVVLGGLSAFHLVRDRSLAVPTPHLLTGPRQHQDDCVQMTRSQLDTEGGGRGVDLCCQTFRFRLACGLLHSVHLAGTDRSTKYDKILTQAPSSISSPVPVVRSGLWEVLSALPIWS